MLGSTDPKFEIESDSIPVSTESDSISSQSVGRGIEQVSCSCSLRIAKRFKHFCWRRKTFALVGCVVEIDIAFLALTGFIGDTSFYIAHHLMHQKKDHYHE